MISHLSSKEAKPKRNEALEYYRRIVTSNKLNIQLFEEVLEVKKIDTHFSIRTTKKNYMAKHVILPQDFTICQIKLEFQGKIYPRYHITIKIHTFMQARSLAIVGASNSAIDAALECWRKGAEVTLIIRGSEVGQRVKYWVRPDIINRIEEGSIAVYYNSEVKEIANTKSL